jgi:alkylhydroperoxidase/carboxymuconolactone decarboxylase family protein YurZ
MTATTQTRIPPLEAPFEPSIAELLAKFPAGPGDEPLRLFRTLAVHPDLASRMRPLGGGILRHGRLDPREREIVIHRACARAGAEYEWGVHAVAFAEEVGLTEAQLAATVHGDAGDPAWSEGDALLVALCDELHDTATVSDALWARLADEWDPAQLIELITTAGWYRLISGLINACGVAPEEWGARFPAAP